MPITPGDKKWLFLYMDHMFFRVSDKQHEVEHAAMNSLSDTRYGLVQDVKVYI